MVREFKAVLRRPLVLYVLDLYQRSNAIQRRNVDGFN